MQVEDIMTRNPVCATPDTDVRTIARMMNTKQCGAIPIVRDQTSRFVVGVVTDRDITGVLAEGENPLEKTARDCMTSPVLTIGLKAGVQECCRLMERNHIRRIPVVDARGACCGIVSLDEIACWLPNEMTAALLRAVMRPLRSSFQIAETV